MSDAVADCQALLASVLSFAAELLTSQGGFIPFGGALRPDGQLVSVAGYDGTEHPEPTDVMAFLTAAFVAAARNGDYKATAVVCDVSVKVPGSEEKSDAIAVLLDHRDGYAVVVHFPYRIDSGKLSLEDSILRDGGAGIFPVR